MAKLVWTAEAERWLRRIHDYIATDKPGAAFGVVESLFHRECKGKPGQPITDFWDVWRNALQAAGLPAGRLFRDLRRSAVRTLIRAGVDETTAMKVSGHKTRSMLLRYNIVTERETADALLRADAHLSTQPNERRKRKGTLRAIHADGGATR